MKRNLPLRLPEGSMQRSEASIRPPSFRWTSERLEDWLMRRRFTVNSPSFATVSLARPLLPLSQSTFGMYTLPKFVTVT